MNNYYHSLYRNIVLDFKRNKIRTFLTSLGITIGVFAVVMLIALGLGLKNFIASQFQDLGANVVAVFPAEGPGNFSSLAGSIRFDSRDLRTLDKINGVDYAIPAFITNAKVETKSAEHNASIIGVSEEYIDLFALEVLDGKQFTRGDVSTSAKVGLVAESLAEELFTDPYDAVGQVVKVKNMRVKVIGLLKNVGNPERDNALIIPYTTTFLSLNPDKEFFLVYLGIEDSDKVPFVKQKAEEELLERYEEDEFTVTEPAEILATLDQIFVMLNGVLVAIGSISLIVGGIGIMNIMYANVTERTREIGIRRAVGANKLHILFQFMTESLILSIMGGLLGLILAIFVVLFVRPFFPVEISPLAVGIAVGVSSFIGVFFGVFPARRAANLTPIEAIRY